MKKTKTMKRNTILEAMTYAYIRRIKKWMFCPACQNGKMTINKKSTLWTCEECGYKLSADEFEDNYVFWFCDECNTYLNNQEGFDRNTSKHICRNCGYENDITSDNLKGICSDCGRVIPDPDSTLCADCRLARHQKAKERFVKGVKIAGAAATVVGTVYLASQATDDDENSDYIPLPGGDDDEGEDGMKCANCGNTDENTLWDEDDTIYCSKCCHLTSKETGEDDLVECPYCHRMRDRKAMYCRWCNDSAWQESTSDEFEEIDKILKGMGY
ncbi:MAG: hypothetical protein ACLUV3_08000 [Oscillospiraceae bacterium]|uniref:hypothetical protein n=1 Tax=Porcipelethomonas sp. TaxID=2981675 RepID=UPI00304DA999